MKNIIVTILSLVFVAFFLGCTTGLTKNECLEADWYEIGYIDGTEGAPKSLFQEHAEACLKYNVHVGREAYYRGRDQGLKVYCKQDKGFDWGRLGRKYNHVCPKDLEPDFLAGYTKGNKIFKYQSKIATLEQRLRGIEHQIQSKKKQLSSPSISEKRKAEIRADLNDLDINYKYTLKDLRHLEKIKNSD